jgi:hypothetical protein
VSTVSRWLAVEQLPTVVREAKAFANSRSRTVAVDPNNAHRLKVHQMATASIIGESDFLQSLDTYSSLRSR